MSLSVVPERIQHGCVREPLRVEIVRHRVARSQALDVIGMRKLFLGVRAKFCLPWRAHRW
jgi:hypothetical protein